MTYPTKASERVALRSKYAHEAWERGSRTGRSLKCAGDASGVGHAGDPGGCANDGSTCLCPCHDYGARNHAWEKADDSAARFCAHCGYGPEHSIHMLAALAGEQP